MAKIDKILEKMLTASRKVANDRVPYAFEKRVMAHIKDTPQMTLSMWVQWSQGLWRSVIPCVAIMILVAVWTNTRSTSNQATETSPSELIAQSDPAEDQLETVVMLAIDSEDADQ